VTIPHAIKLFANSKSILTALAPILAAAFLLNAQDPAQRAKMNHDPDAAKFVTSDIGNFWRAYTQASTAASPEEREKIYQREYLDKASPGLKDFIDLRIKSAHNLVRAIDSHPKYYASLKNVTPRVPQMEPQMRASFRKLKELYSDAVFPDVYFLIGIMNSGGTTGPSGLLIGTEMHGKQPDTDMSDMDNWYKAVLGPIDELPGIVAHELIHYQQNDMDTSSLLGQSIHEGTADFIGEMISGQTINKHLRAYGDAHEAELWSEFQAEMNGKDVSHWLYQGDKSTDRPADLGYYMGARIAESYYQHAADKKQAIRDILTVTDYDAFLRASHYADKFSAAAPNPTK
jgi:hypothetical protein